MAAEKRPQWNDKTLAIPLKIPGVGLSGMAIQITWSA
jgi:hypothetical protein